MLGQLEIVCIGAFGMPKIKDAECTRAENHNDLF